MLSKSILRKHPRISLCPRMEEDSGPNPVQNLILKIFKFDMGS